MHVSQKWGQTARVPEDGRVKLPPRNSCMRTWKDSAKFAICERATVPPSLALAVSGNREWVKERRVHTRVQQNSASPQASSERSPGVPVHELYREALERVPVGDSAPDGLLELLVSRADTCRVLQLVGVQGGSQDVAQLVVPHSAQTELLKHHENTGRHPTSSTPLPPPLPPPYPPPSSSPLHLVAEGEWARKGWPRTSKKTFHHRLKNNRLAPQTIALDLKTMEVRPMQNVSKRASWPLRDNCKKGRLASRMSHITLVDGWPTWVCPLTPLCSATMDRSSHSMSLLAVPASRPDG